MKIAIHQNKKIFNHSITWEKEWIKYCVENKINYEIVDCFRRDIIDKLKQFNILVWHYQNYVLQDMLFARSILNSAEKLGIKVFPNYATSWHFDDKVAQSFLLHSVKAPIPKYWFFAEEKKAILWVENDAKFPIIAKLRCGAGSHNVKMIKTKNQAKKYIKKIFTSGFNSSPNIYLKASSNFRSSKNSLEILKKIKKIPDFLSTLLRANRFSKEKDYAYFQEFIPNNGFDLKIVVVGNKACFLVRKIREGDFRASGSGESEYKKELVSKNTIKSAFKITRKLKLQCMGFDYVINNKTKEEKIIEMSYGFSHTILQGAGGYWDEKYKWHNKKINIPFEILKNIISSEI